MRKTTLFAVTFAITFVSIFLLRDLLWRNDLWIGPRTYAGTGIISLLLSPLVAAALTPFNRILLARRKEAGRDIEEEGRYESDHGMISLKPKDDN